MELYEFTKMLKELMDFYERKEPKQGTIELWFGKVSKVPSEPIKWIVNRIENDYETFPKNFCKAIMDTYREWTQANPDKRAAQRYYDCPDCNEGLIWARKLVENKPYTYVFRCLKCKQNTTQAYPLASRLELRAEYDVIPKLGDLSETAKKYRNWKELVKNVSDGYGMERGLRP